MIGPATLAAAVLALASAALPVPARAAGAGGRFAVVAGNNLGAPARAHLLFAEKDAERFHRTLVELGDFPEDRVINLRGARADDFRAALARIETQILAARARGAGERALLVVYYSGHAGAGGLEFGADTVGYDEMKALVARSSADAKVVIVDACEAGVLTQVKGARPSEAVAFPLPQDEVQGTAYIASTAVGESAQESTLLGGSFFTHNLEVGLRGAADADGDGMVTLAEAFRYTASTTVAATSATRVGAQHPTYDFRMAGRGDVVLADLRRADAHLLLPAEPGVLYVLKGPRGLVAEVPAAAAEVSLGLPSGDYAVERRAPEGRAVGSLALGRGEVRQVPRLRPTAYAMARAKGGPLPTELSASSGPMRVGLRGSGLGWGFAAGVRQELGPVGLLVRADYALASGSDLRPPSPIRYQWRRTGASLTALLPLLGGRTLLEGGPTLGGGWNSQSLQDGRHFEAADLAAGASFRLSLPVVASWRSALDLFAGARVVNVDHRRSALPAASLSLTLLWGS